MTEVKIPRIDVETRIDCLLEYLASQGHSVPRAVLNEGIARYEGAFDWVAFEAQLRGAPKQPGPRWPELSKAERYAMEEVFSEWDQSRSFESIRSRLRKCLIVPPRISAKPHKQHASGIGPVAHLEELVDRFESNRDFVEFKALETCLVNWSGLSFGEVLEILDTENDVMMAHLQVWSSQAEMTPAELAAKIRSEYRFFLRHTPKTN
jgi:hypothetical protein